MLKLHLLTVHPTIVEAYSRFGVLRAALDKNLAQISAIDLRDYAVDKHGSVDDHPYGGGDGMVLRPEPLAAAIDALPEKPRVLLMTPAGKQWTQSDAVRLSASEQPLLFVAGRFAGVDQRFVEQYVDEEISAGDFVLAGGELPALMMMEAMLRLVPGVLGHQDSAAQDSFTEAFAHGLEHPLYTRPPVFRGAAVPPVLLSGDHGAIAKWRQEESRRRTRQLRPDLLK